MGFKLDKEERARVKELITRLEDERADLESSIEEYNRKVQEAWSELEEKINTYNETLVEVQDFMSEVSGRLSDELYEKSDKFQESDKGCAISSMIEFWENYYDFDEIEMESPEDIELEAEDHAKLLGDLPEAPEV